MQKAGFHRLLSRVFVKRLLLLDRIHHVLNNSFDLGIRSS